MGLRLPHIITYIYISLLQPLREPVGWWLCSLEKLTKTTNHRITAGGYKICPSMLNVAHTDSSVWTGQLSSSTIACPLATCFTPIYILSYSLKQFDKSCSTKELYISSQCLSYFFGVITMNPFHCMILHSVIVNFCY